MELSRLRESIESIQTIDSEYVSPPKQMVVVDHLPSNGKGWLSPQGKLSILGYRDEHFEYWGDLLKYSTPATTKRIITNLKAKYPNLPDTGDVDDMALYLAGQEVDLDRYQDFSSDVFREMMDQGFVRIVYPSAKAFNIEVSKAGRRRGLDAFRELLLNSDPKIVERYETINLQVGRKTYEISVEDFLYKLTAV